MKDKPIIGSTQDILTIDSATGRVSTMSKPLADEGELDLSFDEWHQAWQRLLDLIKSFIPEDFLAWEKHYLSILNNDNRAESWPLFLAYDAEIRRRTTQFPIDPSVFSVGIWNDLEARYMTNRVVSLVQPDLKLQLAQHSSRNSNWNSSFQDQQRSDNPKSGRCIFCGDFSKEHMSQNCSAPCNIKGSPCYVFKHGQSNARCCKARKVTATPGMAFPVVIKAPLVDTVSTGAPCADQKHTMPKNVTPCHDLLAIVTPFIPNKWERLLNNITPFNNFSNVPTSMCFSFNMGIKTPPTHTYTPPN